MSELVHKEQLEITSQQSDGLVAMVALAVFLYVANSLLPFWGSSANPAEPFSKREKGMLAIALNVDDQERGVYFLPPEATINDFMLAIGTTIPRGFDRGMGSHRLLTGDKIYLTSAMPYSPVRGKMSVAQSLALDLPIDINKANFDELVLVPGIGARTAAQIIALRSAKGSLRSLAELKEIKGIKEKKFDKLKKYFFVLP